MRGWATSRKPATKDQERLGLERAVINTVREEGKNGAGAGLGWRVHASSWGAPNTEWRKLGTALGRHARRSVILTGSLAPAGRAFLHQAYTGTRSARQRARAAQVPILREREPIVSGQVPCGLACAQGRSVTVSFC